MLQKISKNWDLGKSLEKGRKFHCWWPVRTLNIPHKQWLWLLIHALTRFNDVMQYCADQFNVLSRLVDPHLTDPDAVTMPNYHIYNAWDIAASGWQVILLFTMSYNHRIAHDDMALCSFYAKGVISRLSLYLANLVTFRSADEISQCQITAKHNKECNRWLSARLRYLQCVSNGDTAVLH